MIDVDQQINSVRRTVGTRVLEAGQARTVTISRTFGAAIEDVWDACTSAERIPRHWTRTTTQDQGASPHSP
jgi:phytoene/squalene synthetase